MTAIATAADAQTILDHLEVMVQAGADDTSEMMDVVEEMTSRYHVSLRLVGPEYADGWVTSKGWHATFIESDYVFTDVGEGSCGDTPALAICRAAYKFVERESDTLKVGEMEEVSN